MYLDNKYINTRSFFNRGSISLNPYSDIIDAMLINEKLKIKKTEDLQKSLSNKIIAWNNISKVANELNDTMATINANINTSLTINDNRFISVTNYKEAMTGDYFIDVISTGLDVENAIISDDIADIHQPLGIVGRITDFSKEYEVIIDSSDSLYTLVQKLNTLNPIGSSDDSYKNIDPYSGSVAFIDGNKLVLNLDNSVWNSQRLKSILSGAGISTTTGAYTSQGYKVSVNGNIYYSSTNEFNINGLKFLAKEVGSGTLVSIKKDINKENIFEITKSTIEAFNKFSKTIKDYSNFNGDFSSRGILNGEPSILFLKNKLSTLSHLKIADNNNFDYLFTIGISVDKYGQITLNERKFTETLESNPEEVKEILTRGFGEHNANPYQSGFFARIQNIISIIADDNNSIISAKVDNLKDRLKYLDNRLIKETSQLEKRRAILEKQFRATNIIMSSTNNQMNYLKLLDFSPYEDNK